MTTCVLCKCNKEDAGEKIKFFRFPKTSNILLKKLSAKRHKAWVKALRASNCMEEITSNSKICSRHFISGRSAMLEDVESPDWIPSLNMRNGKETELAMVQTHLMLANSTFMDPLAEHYISYEDMNDVEEEKTFQSIGTQYDLKSSADVETQTFIPSVALKTFVDMKNTLEEKIKKLENRLSPSLDSFLNDDQKCTYFTSLTYSNLKLLFEHLKYNLPAGGNVLNKFQILLLTLMRLRLDMSFRGICYHFHVSTQTISKYFYKCLPILYSELGALIVWPERNVLIDNMPETFKIYFGQEFTIIIACFEIVMEKPSNPTIATEYWSKTKRDYTTKYLIGITPNETITFISQGYGGQYTDKFVIENCGFTSKLEKGNIIIADKTFLINENENIQTLPDAELLIPTYTIIKDQLDPLNVEEMQGIANLKTPIGRVINLVRRTFMILSRSKFPGSINSFENTDNRISNLDQVVTICCGLINFGRSTKIEV